jgi:adenylate kinase
MVASSLGFPSISTGDILRESVRNKTELGVQARGFMDAGALVPDSLVDAIVRERVGREDCARGFILDGYPRTLKQAEFLEGSFAADELKTLVVGIMVVDEVLVARISGRRSCPGCNKVFGAVHLAAGMEARCDECGSVLIQRKDDTAEVMHERLDVYHRQTRPLIEHYRDRGWYYEVDGDHPTDVVLGSILQSIRNNS